MTNPGMKKMIGSMTGLLLALASSCVDEPQTSSTGPSDPGAAGGGPAQTTNTGVGGGGGVDWGEGGKASTCHVDELLDGPTAGQKVKTLLTGQALTSEEYLALNEGTGALGDLIDGWIETEQGQANLRRFFMSALQQDGISRENFLNLFGRDDVNTGRFRDKLSQGGQLPDAYPNNQGPAMDFMFRRALSESMARTAVQLVMEGAPFNNVVDTDTYVLNTALMAMMAFTDDNVVGDDKSFNLRNSAGHFDTIRLVSAEDDAPPASEAFDPKHPNFGVFYHPGLRNMNLEACGYDSVPTEIVIESSQTPVQGQWKLNFGHPSFFVFSHSMLARSERVVRHGVSGCFAPASIQARPLLEYADFFDWRTVQLAQPVSKKPVDLFYELSELRSKKELTAHTPRRGFLSHPGFFGTWMTNEDNGSRVTVNQALIVALGKTFESSVIPGYEPTNVDLEHAGDTECYGCHQTLDPMRDLMRGSFTNYYGHQLDPERKDKTTDFVFGGVESYDVSGVEALSQTLAEHPGFAAAWAQKLCYFANAAPCPKTEELDRVVTAFVDANLDFRVLLRQLFSSPLVTGGGCIEGAAAGTSATIARRSTFCAQLSERLGVPDICALSTEVQAQSQMQRDVSSTMESVPDDSYSRDEVAPVTIAQTGMFVRANREAACNFIGFKSAPILFPGLSLTPSAAEVEQGVTTLVEQIMGLVPEHPLYGEAKKILRDHVDEVSALVPEGHVAPLGSLVGLISAVPLACMAPSSAGVGF